MTAMRDEGWIEAKRDGRTLTVRAGGRWLVADAAALDRSVAALDAKGLSNVRIDAAAVDALDTAGAWLLVRLRKAMTHDGTEVSVENLDTKFAPLMEQVEKHAAADPPPAGPGTSGIVDALASLGAAVIAFLGDARDVLGFFGLVVVTALRTASHPRGFRFTAFVSHVQRTGVSALPIVGLLSFLIGIVFAYQGAQQLRQFGAEIYTVNLLGVSFFRELGVLLAAIIVAGRSGSAFTAEIGTMQVNEEVDAMKTIGLDPVEILVLPRLFALMLTLPMLGFYGALMGLAGGALMCDLSLNIPLPIFLQQLRASTTGWSFWLGILKAPFFAVCIALVGCREGLRAARSADSVGRLTTLSVVESIFLVIVLDAAFSILFAKLGI